MEIIHLQTVLEPRQKPGSQSPFDQTQKTIDQIRESPAKGPRLYTKTGDRGTTSAGGRRGEKFEVLPELFGEIDELNSLIGCIIESFPALDRDLTKIQRILMRMSSHLHGARENAATASDTKWLEDEIDRISAQLPVITDFILPRGQIHVSRAVCRRVERRLGSYLSEISSPETKAGSDQMYLQFMNRLSDYLFALAREQSQPDIHLKEENGAD